jgi:hypothetical protein
VTEESTMTDEATAESTSDSSPDSSTSEQNVNAEKPEKEINQEAVNKRFNDITEQRYKEKARADAAEQRLKELEAQQQITPAPAGQTTTEPPVEIQPPSPDLFYDDPDKYASDMAVYQEQVASKAFAKQQEAAQIAERQRLESEQTQQRDIQRQISVEESAKTHNIDIEELNKSAVILNQRGTNPSLGDMLLEHENSAPLIDYLAKNPGDFDQLNQLTNPLAIIRSLDSIQSKALQRNVSEAPEPVTGLNGLGVREGDEFDKKCAGAVFK